MFANGRFQRELSILSAAVRNGEIPFLEYSVPFLDDILDKFEVRFGIPREHLKSIYYMGANEFYFDQVCSEIYDADQKRRIFLNFVTEMNSRNPSEQNGVKQKINREIVTQLGEKTLDTSFHGIVWKELSINGKYFTFSTESFLFDAACIIRVEGKLLNSSLLHVEIQNSEISNDGSYLFCLQNITGNFISNRVTPKNDLFCAFESITKDVSKVLGFRTIA